MESNATTTSSTSSVTNTSTSTTSTHNNDNKNKTTEYDSLMQRLEENEIDPKDIRYDEYKNLSKEDINILYPKDTMEKENSIAMSLQLKANLTDDEVMNKVLFEKEIESYDSKDAEYIKSANDISNAVFYAEASLYHSVMAMDAVSEVLYNNAMANKYGADSLFQEYSETMKVSIGNTTREYTYTRTSIYTKDQGLQTSSKFTATEVFNTFDTIDKKYQEIINKHNYNDNSHFHQATKAVASYHQEIKNEYHKRASDNAIMLHTHTRSSSYAQFSYSSDLKNETQTIIKNKDNEVRYPESQKYSEIISTLFSGDYKTEEEYLLKSMDTQKYYKNREINDKEYIQLTKEHYEGKFSNRNFTEFIDKLGMGDLSDDEKELYKSIIKDRWVTNEEVSSLSYEQLKTLSKFYESSDDNEKYIGDSDIPTDYKAQQLMRTVNISNDDVYNKMIFDRISSMQNDEEISAYMSVITANEESFYHDMAQDKLSNPSKSPKVVLEYLISLTETKVADAKTTDDKILYESMLGIYKELEKEYIDKLELNESKTLEK